MKKIFHTQNKIYSTKLKFIKDNNDLLKKDIIIEFGNPINTKMNLKDSFKNQTSFEPKNGLFFNNRSQLYDKR